MRQLAGWVQKSAAAADVALEDLDGGGAAQEGERILQHDSAWIMV